MFALDEAKNNHLLVTLPVRDFDRIRPSLERVSLTTGQVLHQPDAKFEYVYFPTTAVVTLIYLTECGVSVGVGMIGNEGLVGIELFMGTDAGSSMAIVQNAGIAYRMPARDLRSKCAASPACQQAFYRYMKTLLTQASQTAVCNRFHSVQQRFARWLLESADRMHSDHMTMTHEQIASFLGVRRESVSLAAHHFAELGQLKSVRGDITILDRPEIELAACECYQIVDDDYRNLMGEEVKRAVGATAVAARWQ